MSQKESQTISDFINGTLSEEKRNRVSNQIKNHSIKGETNKMKANNKNTFDANKAWVKFKDGIENNKTITSLKKPIFKIQNVAASIIILIGITISGYFLIDNFSKTQFAEISSGNKIKEITLPDGSLITLNNNSTMKFPEKFSNVNRTVEFSGEGFFEIEKNPEKPFIIKSNNAEITVLGTSFNVSASVQNEIKVTVKTGKVKLSKNKKKNIILNPEEEGKIENNKLYKTKNIDKNYLSWKTKCFEYNGEQLRKVIDDFNKVYKANIIIEDTETAKLPIVSNPQNKTLEVALEIICSANNLKFKQENNKIIISKN